MGASLGLAFCQEKRPAPRQAGYRKELPLAMRAWAAAVWLLAPGLHCLLRRGGEILLRQSWTGASSQPVHPPTHPPVHAAHHPTSMIHLRPLAASSLAAVVSPMPVGPRACFMPFPGCPLRTALLAPMHASYVLLPACSCVQWSPGMRAGCPHPGCHLRAAGVQRATHACFFLLSLPSRSVLHCSPGMRDAQPLAGPSVLLQWAPVMRHVPSLPSRSVLQFSPGRHACVMPCPLPPPCALQWSPC